MALFNRLLRLKSDDIYRLEDFFTEIVAHYFEANQQALKSWLQFIGIVNDNNWENASITTQKSYQDTHENKERRPDIVVEILSNDTVSIVFFESKIGSQEGQDQLRSYARILDQLTGYRKKYIVYITRDFDAKVPEVVLQDVCNSEVKFIQLRWHQFYQFLSTQPQSALVHEIQLFMQEQNMAQSNQFSAIDIVALTHFSASLKLMEQVMWGKTLQKFEEVLEKQQSIQFRQRRALQNIQWHGRYIMGVWMPGKWWCYLGFQLKVADYIKLPFPHDYPVVKLNLEIDPKSPHRQTTIQEFKSISEQYHWQEYRLNEPETWSGISMNKSLRNFLVEADHVSAIESFFLEALRGLEEIRKKYPHLPWGTTFDDDEESNSKPE